MSSSVKSSGSDVIPYPMSTDGAVSEHHEPAPISFAEASMHLSVRALFGIPFGVLICVVVSLCVVQSLRLVPGMEKLVRESWIVENAARFCLVLWMTGWLVFSLKSLFGSLLKLVRSFWRRESPKQRWCALAMHVLVWPITLYQVLMAAVLLLCLVTGEEIGS